MSDVELLRKAAALMRERSQEASNAERWHIKSDGELEPLCLPVTATGSFGHVDPGDAEHIASWDPTVALAVADWLDNVADRLPYTGRLRPEFAHAEAIARAYLREAT